MFKKREIKYYHRKPRSSAIYHCNFSVFSDIFQQMKVYSHRVMARFGLMHMIGTNLSVWLNVLVQETKHEILTFYNPENNSLRISHRLGIINNSTPIIHSVATTTQLHNRDKPFVLMLTNPTRTRNDHNFSSRRYESRTYTPARWSYTRAAHGAANSAREVTTWTQGSPSHVRMPTYQHHGLARPGRKSLSISLYHRVQSHMRGYTLRHVEEYLESTTEETGYATC